MRSRLNHVHVIYSHFCIAIFDLIYSFQDLAVVVLLILIPLISPNSSKGGVTFYTILFVYGCGGELLVSFTLKVRNLHMFCQFVSHTEYSGYNEGTVWNLACTFQCVPFLSITPAVDRSTIKKCKIYSLFLVECK